jgi:hypothetical protein
MTREPFLPSRHAAVAAPLNAGVPHQFEVVFQTQSSNESILLQVATDANTATMVFHQALRRLRTQRAVGDLLVRSSDPAQPPHLRQPFTSRPIHDGYQTHD